MTRLITGLEVHRYAPELNKLHLRNRQTLPAPGITTIKEAKAYQIHVRLDVDWNLRKISVINCLGYVEDLHFTWLLSHYFKTLCSGANVDAFIHRYLPQGFSDGTMA